MGCDLAGLVVVAPATADLIAKMAHGLADDLASTALLATAKPVLLAPAMKPEMWAQPATVRNVALFEQARALGMSASALAAEALATGHTDLGVEGLKLLTGGAWGARGPVLGCGGGGAALCEPLGWTAAAEPIPLGDVPAGHPLVAESPYVGISLTGIQAYASAKAAQIGLTRQLAHELGPWGITVNNIAPGFALTNPNTERQWESYGAEGQQRLLDNIALGRLGMPADIAYGVLFFASEYAAWITGQVLSIDGGK